MEEKLLPYVSANKEVTISKVNQTGVINHRLQAGCEKGYPHWSGKECMANVQSSLPMIVKKVMKIY
jgi:hypothetical protein